MPGKAPVTLQMELKMTTALLVIDIQNDYFNGGSFPLWKAEETEKNVLSAMAKASERGQPVILVQHKANPQNGHSLLFNEETVGVEIRSNIRSAAAHAPVVVKRFADSFHNTTLASILRQHDVTALVLCGMMTQNCVTHTALSKAAEPFKLSILTDCCTTVSEPVHQFAIGALRTRPEIELLSLADWK